jgi:hypothetical protein
MCILENSATRFGTLPGANSAARWRRIPSSAPVPHSRHTVRARERRVDRYYDPATDQFLSVDPDVAETGQPYAFTGDDPLNATDPMGLNPFNPCNWGHVCHHLAHGAARVAKRAASNWCANFPGSIECGGKSSDPTLFVGSSGNLNSKSASYFKKANIDPEDLKSEYGYRSDGDLRVESGTGRVYVGPKNGSPGDMEPTNFRISGGKAIFDPPGISGIGDGFEGGG